MTEIQEQETAQPETLLSAEQTLTSAKLLMSETAAVVAKRQGLRVSHFSMDELIDVATSTTFDGEPVCEVTNVIGRDGSKTVRRIIYFDRGKRSFELGYRDEKVTDPLSGSLKKETRGVIRFGNGTPNTVEALKSVTEKLSRLQKIYA